MSTVSTVSTVSPVSTVSTVSTVITRCYLHLRWYFLPLKNVTENSFRHSYDVPSAYRLSWLTSLLALWLGIKAVLVARLVFRQLQVTLLRSRRLLRIRGLWSSKGEAKPSQDKEDPHQIALACSKTTRKMTNNKRIQTSSLPPGKSYCRDGITNHCKSYQINVL